MLLILTALVVNVVSAMLIVSLHVSLLFHDRLIREMVQREPEGWSSGVSKIRKQDCHN